MRNLKKVKHMMYLKSLALSLLLVFAPIQTAIVALFTLLIIDMITGILAAKKRGEEITSGNLRRSISKLFIYELALMIGFIAETYLIGHIIPVAKIIAGMVGMIELTSILENLNTISGQNLLKGVIDTIGSKNQDIKKL